MPQAVTLILDGGGGTRLGGVQKGCLRLDNVPLGQHVLNRIGAVGGKTLYSCASGGWHPQRTIALHDDPDGLSGPAAGLEAAARWCRANAPGSDLITVSADTPFVPREFPDAARARLESGIGVVVAAFGGRDYPTVAAWNVERLNAALRSFAPGPKGPRLRDVVAAADAAFLDYSDRQAENPFTGVNTLADLLALQARRGAGKPA